MGVHIDKLRRLTMSKWEEHRLLAEQVWYACIDAFVSYEIGRLLLTGQCAEGASGGATKISSPFVASAAAVPVASRFGDAFFSRQSSNPSCFANFF
jgi:hypothetical protein